MKLKVKAKQTGSHDCVVCGMDNPDGLHAQFYSMEDDSCVALFHFNKMNQSYPKGVTMKIEVEYHKPCPYDEPLICVGKITKSTHLTFDGVATLYDSKGNMLDRAKANYFKLPLSQAVNGGNIRPEDVNVLYPDDVTEIDVPEGK